MGTRLYGSSDDLIHFSGDVSGEIECYGTDEREHGVLLLCSDGTLLEAKYRKADLAVWEVKLLNKGRLFEKIEACLDEDADPYSDIAYFSDGLTWIYAATEWERVR